MAGGRICHTNKTQYHSAMEVLAQIRVAAIIHVAVSIPMRWLAGKSHTPAHNGWGEKSMGKALHILHDAFTQVQEGGKFLLDHSFMMSIFLDLYKEIPKLKNYLEYEFEEKQGNVYGSYDEQQRVLAMDEAVAESGKAQDYQLLC